MEPPVDPAALEFMAHFHATLSLVERFDSENIRPAVATKQNHPPREFAITSTYLRSLAQVRTLIELSTAHHFQAIAMGARALFELAVEIPLLDKVDAGPEKHRLFSDLERLRTARQIVAFHATGKVTNPLTSVHAQAAFIANHAARVDSEAKRMWPENPQPNHWSAMKLPKRVVVVGCPFDEIFNLNYAELSWYTHPGVGAVAALDAKIYPLVCGNAFDVALRCYVETLNAMIDELGLRDRDPLIDKKLKLARMQAFAKNPEQAETLRRQIFGES